jgi:hypothetical protein
VIGFHPGIRSWANSAAHVLFVLLTLVDDFEQRVHLGDKQPE